MDRGTPTNGPGRKMPEVWVGELVWVSHPVNLSDNLTVGGTYGTLLEVNDRGCGLAVRDSDRGPETRFFPWPSVIQIVRPESSERLADEAAQVEMPPGQ